MPQPDTDASQGLEDPGKGRIVFRDYFDERRRQEEGALLREFTRLRQIEAKHSELVELAGRIVDRLDNLLGALKLPLPPHIHLMGLRGSLPEIRAELAEALDRALRGEEEK